HVLVYLNEADNERYNHDWLALRNELDSLETRLLPDGALPRLAATVASGKAINLLQGDFAVKSEGNPSLKPWRLVAALLLATLVVSIVQKATDYYSLQRELNRAQVQLEQQWQKTLPWIKPVPDNPGSRLSAELRRMGQAQAGEQDAQLLKALAALSTALKVSPDSKIEDISFSSGVTAIQLLVPNTDQLDKIQSGVQASPELDALILRAEKNNDGDGMLSRLQIKASAK
ncbi:MAG: type II secretion system protein GspL, partial [Pseudomonadota bacterium]